MSHFPWRGRMLDWESGNKLVQLAKFAIGTVTGKDMTRDDNVKVKMNPG